jgi:hypothetical protein
MSRRWVPRIPSHPPSRARRPGRFSGNRPASAQLGDDDDWFESDEPELWDEL